MNLLAVMEILPYFNSIKVRLELRVLHYAVSIDYDFNSIKVRLERILSSQREPPYPISIP